MQLACPRCGEPWDHDSLHDEAAERYGIPYYLDDNDRRAYRRNPAWDEKAYGKVFAEVSLEFRTVGCSALKSYGAKCTPADADRDAAPEAKNFRAAAAGAMYELLGDDLDGAAAMLEDLGL